MTRIVVAMAVGLGLAVGAWAKDAETVLPATGPISKTSMQRLLLTDGARVGNRVVAVGDRGYIVFSDDNGTSWKRAKAPDGALLTSVEFIDAKRGWAVGHDSVILATVDGGESWTQQFSAPSEQRPLLDIHLTSPEAGLAVGAYGAFYDTADGGKTWTARKVVADDKHLNAIVKLADGKLLILGEAGTMLVSADAGKTWTALTSPYKGSFFGGLPTADGGLVAFGLRGRIYRSPDGGKSWKQIDNTSVATLMGGTLLPDGALVVAGNAGTVLVSRDQGNSFVPLATGTTRAFSKALLGAPNAVLLLGEAGAREVPLPSAPR
ncbi:WD40/YVTN/BNR-like repeat-containing protein [Usitatibacter palustris]|uniref:Ycf48-like protein n=1 Tax=Usitatibacter palustris TaxID=2732487 RepID=A0A6M4H2Z9_9PROT|nr:YCF48-related protein [Usitatibacter palustris]QJR13939.1 Ycf48-like protein [Usitatibacter palustris]